MRRGRSGIGGWRNDNPRHFRPRSGGMPHIRPPRNYGLTDTPRFPPPGAVLHRPPPFIARHIESSNIHENKNSEIHGNEAYRHFPNTQTRPPNRGHFHQRQILPYLNNHRQNNNHYNSHQRITFENTAQTFQGTVNDLGDVDHRVPPNLSRNQDNHGKRHTTWINPAIDIKKYDRNYDKSPQKYYRNYEVSESNRLLSEDYTGHRPPSSDHYDSSCIQSNTAFTRSVDDTVDIIRKRLKDRSDGQLSSQQSGSQDNHDQIITDSNKSQQEQPLKRKTQRPVQVKSNCDKIKNNIIHQLFEMDKNKIHKLMDNPSSSTKFDYAISSLITESQNSLNRQMRSVAEKSLNTCKSNYINDDNNTIYEDTFMKQMQCILDPQDTVFLEDIKPIVMAELNKVLQLDEYVQECDIYEGFHAPCDANEEPDKYYDDHSSSYTYEDKLYEQELESELYYNKSNARKVDDNYTTNQESSQLYQRRPAKSSESAKEMDIDRRYSTDSQRRQTRQSIDSQRQTRQSIDSQRQTRQSIDSQSQTRQSIDKSYEDPQNIMPLFNSSAENFSEDEDPFAELDKQYHVAVDHNFINNDDFCSPAQSVASSSNKSPNISQDVTTNIPVSNLNSITIKHELDTALEKSTKSPLKLQLQSKIQGNIKLEFVDHLKENISNTLMNNENSIKEEHKIIEIKTETTTKSNEINSQKEKSENCSNIVKVSSPNTRKRSINQMPSHRKEKRKKSESSPTNVEQQNVNTNNTCQRKSQTLTKDNSSPIKKLVSSDKMDAEKYVKRKKEGRKSKDIELNKKNLSSLPSHSILSQKDNSSTSVNNQIPSKSDMKIKLKTIDMFMDQPKKSTALHQAHRNTATASAVLINRNVEENKTKQLMSKTAPKVTVSHVSTQVMKKVQTKEVQTTISKCSKSRFVQTERKKLNTIAIQTDPVSFEKSTSKATDCFERMKEIDLEIQVLLQEKFKLYNSIESKESCQSTVQTLGMTVLSVTPLDEEKIEEEDIENTLAEDAIVDSFTSIPTEELEQIALETVEHEKADILLIEKTGRRKKPMMRDDERNSASPTITKSGRLVKPPNISLIEQIITSDKPLEDIIVLDELETENTPVKSTKKRPPKRPAKKKTVKNRKVPKQVKDYSAFHLRECSVKLERQDISQYLIQLSDLEIRPSPSPQLSPSTISLDSVPEVKQTHSENIFSQECKLPLEEDVRHEEIQVNDIQLDMLDVSEDIVIGDVCEIKCDDSGNAGIREMAISEEIILDNSQSSCEEVFYSDSNQEESGVCKMFDYSTDENLIKDSITVSGNADAVLAIENIENNFLAACLDGNVYHFNGDGQLLNTLRGSNLAVTCLTIVKEKTGTTVYTGSLDSRIRHYDLETGLEKGLECNVLSPIQTMDRNWDTVFVGTRTGFVLQFECKNNMLIPVSTVKFSDQSILALRAIKEGPRKVLLVAARSEDVTIKDAQTGLLLRTLAGPKMTVYTLLFEDGKVYCGTSSHQVHVFDYASGSHVGAHEGGKGAVCLRSSGGLLFAGCYDGCVYVYKEGEPRPLAQLRGPGLMLLSLAIVGTKIIAGYKDRSLYIWKIPLSILREMIL